VAHQHRGQPLLHPLAVIQHIPPSANQIPHQLPQLTSGRWSDPRLGQSTHPQQIRQIRSVTLIFSELKTILKF
jgi:hypothetical protein